MNDTATPPGDGLSWATAFPTLDQALAASDASPGTDEIRITRGTYVPSTLWIPGDARSATFAVPSGTTIQGGWNAVTNQPPAVGSATATILSGGLGAAGRAYHVVRVKMFNDPTDPGVALKNMTIRDGNANNASTGDTGGGGIFVESTTSSLALDTCRVLYNSATGDGAGLHSAGSNTVVVWCHFADNNAAGLGGAVYSKSRLVLFTSSFVDNTADVGGALAVDNGTIPSAGEDLLAGCCRFKGNSANSLGGALAFEGAPGLGNADYRIDHFTFSANSAGTAGGALYAATGGLRSITNSILWMNSAPSDPEAPAGLCIDYSDVYDPSGAIYAGCIGANINLDPLLAGNQHLSSTASGAYEAGHNFYSIADWLDLDGDGITIGEKVPLDIGRNPRLNGSQADMGAWEL